MQVFYEDLNLEVITEQRSYEVKTAEIIGSSYSALSSVLIEFIKQQANSRSVVDNVAFPCAGLGLQ